MLSEEAGRGVEGVGVEAGDRWTRRILPEQASGQIETPGSMAFTGRMPSANNQFNERKQADTIPTWPSTCALAATQGFVARFLPTRATGRKSRSCSPGPITAAQNSP